MSTELAKTDVGSTTKQTLKFEFGVYTDVTELALRINPEYTSNNVIKVFLCPDVHDVWLCRLIEGLDEEYNSCDGSYLLERNAIPNYEKGQKLSINRAMKILSEDEFDNYDYKTSTDVNELIDMVDGGFGILNFNKL